MVIGERFRSGGTRGIARFLAHHQRCEASFDVRREDRPGSGRLKITCEGCGETVSYRAAYADDLTAGMIGEAAPGNGVGAAASLNPEVPPEPPAQPPSPPPPPQPAPAATPVPPKPRMDPFAGTPGWVSGLLIGLLIAAALGMIVAGLLSSDEGANPAPTPTSAPAVQVPDPAVQGSSAAAAGGAEVAEEPPTAVEPADFELESIRVPDVFVIGIGEGWQRGEVKGGISIKPDGGDAEIRVIFEYGERPIGELADAAADFLEAEHRGARVGSPETIRIGGEQAVKVPATYGGGTEDAVVLSGNDFAFLLLLRVDRDASEQVEREANVIMASFRAGN